MAANAGVEDLLRDLAPRVLGVLVRRYGDFYAAEDALQEALLSAAVQWAADGLPRNPRGWLTTVAARRLTDEQRKEAARRRREATAVAMVPDHRLVADLSDAVPQHDDTLSLLFLCCHPGLTTESQVALTLRAVGGLTTAEIARAFLVPEDTMTRRISRAKRSIAAAGASFGSLTVDEREQRLDAVLRILYLIFNEGYTSSRCTTCSSASLRATRWSPSTAPSLSRWWTARMPGSPCWRTWRPTAASPGTIGYPRYAPTCSSWPATSTPPTRPT